MIDPTPRDYTDPDDRAEPVEARPVSVPIIIMVSLAGLFPAFLFGVFVWWAI